MKTIESEFETWKMVRQNEAFNLEQKLRRVARWQKRYDKLMSEPYNKLIEQRMLRLKELASERNIKFTVNPDPYSNSMYAVYQKEKVKMELRCTFSISSEGVVGMDFWCPKRNAYPLRIAVGKVERVTDRILVTLLGNHGPKPW